MSQLKFKVLSAIAIIILIWIVLSSGTNKNKFLDRVIKDENIVTDESIDTKDIVFKDDSIDLEKIVKSSISKTISEDLNKEDTLSPIEEYEKEARKVEDLAEKILIGVEVYEEDGKNKFEEAMNNDIVEDKEINTDIVGSLIDRTKSAPIDFNMNYRKASLIEVLSGNEIIASIDDIPKVVKLIGIDDEENSYKALNSILSGLDVIYLEFDVKRYDENDRALAYIWLSEPTRERRENMVNGILIKSGYAKANVEPPNISYISYFAKLEKESNK